MIDSGKRDSKNLVVPAVDSVTENTTSSFDVERVIREASLQEKINLLSGIDFWHTKPIPRFRVPSIRLTDGPNGARGTRFFAGQPAACLPCGSGLAATWDLDLIQKAGVLIGEECKAKGAHCWLGPTINIQRSPVGGRGFESFSEDPYLSGKLSGGYIKGAQSTGVIATVKHFVANDQEHERMAVDVQITDRALREIYLLPFQIAVHDGKPGAIMAAYNKINGTHVSESKLFLETLLREEWGWSGMIMSDWFGTYSTSEALNAGLDLEMPGTTRWRGAIAEVAVSSRKVTMATINSRARNVLNFVKRASEIEGISPIESKLDRPEDRIFNRKLAGEGIVLLKNDKNVLPLPSDINEIALIGPNLKNVAFCGGGSAQLEPYYTISPYQGIVDQLTQGGKRTDVNIHYEVGAHAHGLLPTLGEHIKTPDGQPGLRIRFYSEEPGVPNREIIDEAICPDSIWQLMGYAHPQLGKQFYADIEGLYTAPATGKIEFGIASYGTSSLFIDDELLIDNTTIQRPGVVFFGKGSAEEKAAVEMVEGRSYKIRLEFGSATTSKVVKPGVVSFGGGAGRLGAAVIIDPEEAIARAVKIAKECKYTIVCAGLSQDWEAEGFDRPTMDLPGYVPQLISAVLAVNPDAVIVTQSGTPVNMQLWAAQATTQVHMWYGGNETGNGLADALFGAVNPAGRLPMTFPKRIEDTPAFLNFESERGRVVYGEGIYVGYRFYEKVKREVEYPFGHGLSYTNFGFSSLQVADTKISLTVENTGTRPGSTVVQVYISPPSTTSISRPKKELKGFTKVFLQAGEKKEVVVHLDRFATSFWDEILHSWVQEEGTYGVLVGESSADIRLAGDLVLNETTTWTGL